MSTTAPAVSAYIRRNTGYTPVPRAREGVHVTRVSATNRVAVTIDIDGPRHAQRVYDEVATALREQYTVRHHPHAFILYVTTKES